MVGTHRVTTKAVIIRQGGSSSIPEMSALEPRSHDVLGPPPSRGTSSVVYPFFFAASVFRWLCRFFVVLFFFLLRLCVWWLARCPRTLSSSALAEDPRFEKSRYSRVVASCWISSLRGDEDRRLFVLLRRQCRRGQKLFHRPTVCCIGRMENTRSCHQRASRGPLALPNQRTSLSEQCGPKGDIRLFALC